MLSASYEHFFLVIVNVRAHILIFDKSLSPRFFYNFIAFGKVAYMLQFLATKCNHNLAYRLSISQKMFFENTVSRFFSIFTRGFFPFSLADFLLLNDRYARKWRTVQCYGTTPGPEKLHVWLFTQSKR